MASISLKKYFFAVASGVTLTLTTAVTAQTAENSNSSSEAQTDEQTSTQEQIQSGSIVRISGTVETIVPNTFNLDYGEGQVLVEMDDRDRDADSYALQDGDKVTVTGYVDDDLFEDKTIEASSVYVHKIGTYFFASLMDDEKFEFDIPTMEVNSSDTNMTVKGQVAQVKENAFTVESGEQDIEIAVSELSSNPLDDEGYPRVSAGDMVSVTGTVDKEFIEERRMIADSLIKLYNRESNE